MKKSILIATLVSSVFCVAADVDTGSDTKNFTKIDNIYLGLGLGYGVHHNNCESIVAVSGTDFKSSINSKHMLLNVLLGYTHRFSSGTILGAEFDNVFSLNKNSQTKDFCCYRPSYTSTVKDRAWTPSFGILAGYAFPQITVALKGGISFPSVKYYKKYTSSQNQIRGDTLPQKNHKAAYFLGIVFDRTLNKKWKARLEGTYTFKQKMRVDHINPLLFSKVGEGRHHQRRIMVRLMALYSFK